MKTIEQLLQLSKNPYYVFTDSEKMVLDDFLSKQREEHSTSSVKKKKKNSRASTHVRVRNVVRKTVDTPKESGL